MLLLRLMLFAGCTMTNIQNFSFSKIVDFVPLYAIRCMYFSFGIQEGTLNFDRLWKCGGLMKNFYKLTEKFDVLIVGLM